MALNTFKYNCLDTTALNRVKCFKVFWLPVVDALTVVGSKYIMCEASDQKWALYTSSSWALCL